MHFHPPTFFFFLLAKFFSRPIVVNGEPDTELTQRLWGSINAEIKLQEVRNKWRGDVNICRCLQRGTHSNTLIHSYLYTRITQCEIYSYSPDPERNPFSSQPRLRQVYYFFFHRSLRRIVFFAGYSVSKLSMSSSSLPLPDNGDEGERYGGCGCCFLMRFFFHFCFFLFFVLFFFCTFLLSTFNTVASFAT